MSPDNKKLEVLEAVFHDAALAEAEEGASTPEERAWAKQLHARVDAQLSDLERNQSLTPKSAKQIRPDLLALTRDALLAKIEALVSQGKLQVAHRNLESLTDDDLRGSSPSLISRWRLQLSSIASSRSKGGPAERSRLTSRQSSSCWLRLETWRMQ